MRAERECRANNANASLGYLLLRVCLGVNIAMHGLTRLAAGSSIFVAGLSKQFQDTFLPSWSVRAFGFTLPWVETIVGILVLLGLKTRLALVAGGVVIAVLTFGVALVQQWDIAGIQLVYALAFSILLLLHHYNKISLDHLLTTLCMQNSNKQNLPPTG